MKRLGFGALLLLALASMISAQAPLARTAGRPGSVGGVGSPADLHDYCVECHGLDKPKADLNIERLLTDVSPTAVAENWQHWERIAEALEDGAMPPDDATRFPTDPERAGAAAWIRGAMTEYDATHAGQPGRVTVRRLTSAEYAYALGDLTGIDVKVGIDASSDCGRRRGLRQLRRRAVRAGRGHRAVSGIGQAGRRSCRHRRGPALLLCGSRQDGDGTVGAAADRADLCRQRVSCRVG